MINEELKKVNKKHFKDRPNAVQFCDKCDLEELTYCNMCAQRQLNRLGRK